MKRVDEWGFGAKVLGTLLDLITVPPEYAVAVESAAGNALFNLLVTDEEIGADIIKYVRQFQLGSIVCTPLNQIRPRPRRYPQLQGARPLVELISASDEVRPAVQQVFGRTMVCTSIELCDTVSHQHGLDAVTMDGDRVSSQGTMTGGYQDPSRYVRLKLCEERRQEQGKLNTLEAQLPAVEREVEDCSRSLEQLHHRRREAHAFRQTRRAELAQATETLHEQEREQRRLVEAVGREREREHEVGTLLAEYTAGIEALVRERQSKTLGQLTNADHARVESLSNELRELGTKLDVAEEACHALQREIRAQEQHLNGYLRRRNH
jgi:structural maintenance of chromosome 3 (chondroitin sulfate proteoglycan 6)